MADYREALQVEGLRAFRDELRTAGDKFPRELSRANKAVAQLVADKTVTTMRSAGGVLAKSADSVRATGGQLSSSVRLGDDAHPYALGAEFGAQHDVERQTSRGPRKGWNQFKPWRGSGPEAGYALYPTVRSSQTEIAATYDGVIADLMSRAFPE